MSQSSEESTGLVLRLKKGSAKPLHSGHPWVFAGAVAGFSGGVPQPGDETRVVDDHGVFIGRGFYSPSSAIAVRLLTRADTPITRSLFEARIDEAQRLRRDVLKLGGIGAGSTTELSGQEQAVLQALDEQLSGINRFAAQYGLDPAEETAELRKRRDALAAKVGKSGPMTGGTTAYRLVNSEGDGLGGLVVDVYGSHLAVQIGTVGMERRLETILDVLEDRLHPAGIMDRSDDRARQLEKLPPARSGALRGEAPCEPLSVFEEGVQMLCDLRAEHGQKTGLYLDQRENRRRFGELASGRDVLDVFCYSGGFTLHAARGGAKSLTLVESSVEALGLARQNLERNGVADADLIEAAWPEGLKHLRENGRQFDLMVVDPPKYARSKEHLPQALSAYRDLNAQAVRLLAPGGLLFTCSCSGNVTEDDFERAVAAAIRSSGRRAVLLEKRGAAQDHPIPPGFEQGRYLKCLVLQVI